MFMRGQLGFLVIDALSRIINSNKKGEKIDFSTTLSQVSTSLSHTFHVKYENT